MISQTYGRINKHVYDLAIHGERVLGIPSTASTLLFPKFENSVDLHNLMTRLKPCKLVISTAGAVKKSSKAVQLISSLDALGDGRHAHCGSVVPSTRIRSVTREY